MEETEYKLGDCWLMVTGNDGNSLNVKTTALTLSLIQDKYELYPSRGGLRQKEKMVSLNKFNIAFETYSELMVTQANQGVNIEENFSITNGPVDLKHYTVMQLLEEINKKQKLAALIAAQR